MSLSKILASFAVAALLTTTGQAQQAPVSELIYTPVTPCRAFDVVIAANTEKTLLVSGAGFAAQKGPAAGCGVPASASAVSMKIAVLNPAVSGYLIPYAAGTTRPRIAANYYQLGATYSTDALVPMGGRSTTIYSYKTARVLGDVTGYYAPQIRATISADATFIDKSSRVLSVRTDGNYYYVKIDRETRNCTGSAQGTGSGNRFMSVESDGNFEFIIYTYYINSSFTSTQTPAGFRLIANC